MEKYYPVNIVKEGKDGKARFYRVGTFFPSQTGKTLGQIVLDLMPPAVNEEGGYTFIISLPYNREEQQGRSSGGGYQQQNNHQGQDDGFGGPPQRSFNGEPPNNNWK